VAKTTPGVTNPNQSSSSNTLFIAAIAAVVVVGLGVVAVLATGRGDGESTVQAAAETAEVTVEGEGLAPLERGLQVSDPTNDPTIGTQAPTLVASGYDDAPVTIGPDGNPKVIYFLAHWCPHCQRELPAIQDLIDAGELPENLDVYAVSTAVDSGRPNFPASTWFEDEGFTEIVVRDDEAGTALAAFGGSGFPFAVYLDADHQVVTRTSGELGADALTALWAAAVS
jgi:thiol-disulfide isomerase/thioredoxin